MKAILAISFGTTHADAEQNCILAVENAFRTAFGCEVRRAFTSKIILKRLNAQGKTTLGVQDALAAIRADGYDEIIAASTHIIPGFEYEKLRAEAGVPVSEPLLCSDGDLDRMAKLLGSIADEEGRTLLVMGHGTDHAADDTYERLRAKLPANVRLACVEGSHTLESLLPELEVGAVTLMPLMLVAGDHAKNDLAGDGEDSWKSILTARGFDVRARLQGLGELPAVREMFVEKVRKVL